MTKTINSDAWVFVIVQNPGRDEKIVGQQDSEHQINFIPFFLDREAAQQGLFQLIKEPGQNYEVHAIIYEDLTRYAAEGGFLLFVLDGRGHIVSKLSPEGTPL